MEHGAATDTGIVREKNEDNFTVDTNISAYIVADGIGGHIAGEIASYIAVRTIQEYLSTHNPNDHKPAQETILASINAAHEAIHAAAGGTDNNIRMGTTIVLAWIPSSAETAWIAHVGDSRAYLYRDKKLSLLTEDHTLLWQARREGVLPDNPNLWPPRQALSQALGASDHIEPEARQFDLKLGDQILLCTDGLTDMVPDEEISSILHRGKSPQETCDEFIRTAIANGGQDNITAVLVKIDEHTN
jgi:serine/threonine protein phosphatase PrpC